MANREEGASSAQSKARAGTTSSPGCSQTEGHTP